MSAIPLEIAFLTTMLMCVVFALNRIAKALEKASVQREQAWYQREFLIEQGKQR